MRFWMERGIIDSSINSKLVYCVNTVNRGWECCPSRSFGIPTAGSNSSEISEENIDWSCWKERKQGLMAVQYVYNWVCWAITFFLSRIGPRDNGGQCFHDDKKPRGQCSIESNKALYVNISKSSSTLAQRLQISSVWRVIQVSPWRYPRAKNIILLSRPANKLSLFQGVH